jgi:hypothetical protein
MLILASAGSMTEPPAATVWIADTSVGCTATGPEPFACLARRRPDPELFALFRILGLR